MARKLLLGCFWLALVCPDHLPKYSTSRYLDPTGSTNGGYQLWQLFDLQRVPTVRQAEPSDFVSLFSQLGHGPS